MRYNFEWDPNKAKHNLRKHKVSFERAAAIFLDPLAISIYDEEHSSEEDRWITIAIESDEEWRTLCRIMGEPSWAQQDMFGDSFSRWKNQDKLHIYISSWTKQHEQKGIMLSLQKEGIAAGAVLDQRDALNDPHFKERGFFERVQHEDCGIHNYPGMLWKLSETPLGIRKPPIRLGEDNEYVYKKVVGISDEEYEQMVKEGHIGMDFYPEIA